MNTDIINPPTAYGAPLFNAVAKQTAADFRVDEILAIDLCGSGEHLYLLIEKSAMNTDEVVSLLQSSYSVQSADIGLCGLKDRHAIATQWFSIRTTASSEVFELAAQRFNDTQQTAWQDTTGYLKHLRLIKHARHRRKLRRGAHSGNAFCIVLQDVTAEDLETAQPLMDAVKLRIARIGQSGFPAYIGAQRFGQGGQNLQRARQWFARPRKRITRQQRSLYLSTARSALFNRVLASRVRDGHWDQLLPGEPAVLNGSRSFFLAGESSADFPAESANESASLEQRLDAFDIHPSAPWWGRGRNPAQGVCAEYEAVLLDDHAALCAALERAGLSHERRAIRAQATELQHEWLDAKTLVLQFTLSPGVFATTLLRELCRSSEPHR